MSKNTVEIFTDGACSGNPGPGGWGAILRYGAVEKEIKGGAANTTNNQMEMMAAIVALESLKRSCDVTLYTDSRYLSDGVTQWLANWKRKNWQTAQKKPVKNKELWQRLDCLLQQHNITWIWVKGHAGHPENERADQLAREGLQDCREAH